MPLPLNPLTSRQELVQYYLDDFDAPEIVPLAEARRIMGSVSPLQEAQRSAYLNVGVAYSEEKAHKRESQVERMGAWVDGEWGRVSCPIVKIIEAVHFMLWACSLPYIHGNTMLMVLGRFVRIAEFRRPTLSVLNEVWKCSTWKSGGILSAQMVDELLTFAALVPLAYADLRVSFTDVVTVSDASETGGGACASSGVTSKGDKQAASTLPIDPAH